MLFLHTDTDAVLAQARSGCTWAVLCAQWCKWSAAFDCVVARGCVRYHRRDDRCRDAPLEAFLPKDFVPIC